MVQTIRVVRSRRFGSYSIIRKLGEGGMATVYLAETVNERGELLPVAIKFMKPSALRGVSGVDAADLFATEGDVMGLLRHPNLVELYEVGKAGDALFLAMEYCPGGDLEGLLAALRWQDKKVPYAVALQIGIELLKALATVHRAQGVRGTSLELVHGDINPSNIFLSIEKSCAKLGDFGVASSCTLGGGLPKGIAAGKLHYLSPEQAQCKALTAYSDLFAMGVVMYELLVGRRPFMGTSEPDTLERIGASRFDPPELSSEFDGLFEKALAKNPKSRFPSAGAFAAELLRIQVDSGFQETPGELGGVIQEALQVLA